MSSNSAGGTPKTRKNNSNTSNSNSSSYEEDGITAAELRRGPWTLEEDNLLIQYISCHGEGRWNSLAKSSGLNRTGKSCRLRWLNYLKPDIKRGNLTPQEQLVILQLHSKWGNRWSKIAQHLPGRTDNEIKNYWRTRVQKQARQLKVDSNSDKFLEAIRMYWMPSLLEKIEQNSSSSNLSPSSSVTTQLQLQETQKSTAPSLQDPNLHAPILTTPACPIPEDMVTNSDSNSSLELAEIPGLLTPPVEQSSGTQILSTRSISIEDECYHVGIPTPGYDIQGLDTQSMSLPGCHVEDIDWFGEDIGSTFWNTDELWQFRKPEEVVGI